MDDDSLPRNTGGHDKWEQTMSVRIAIVKANVEAMNTWSNYPLLPFQLSHITLDTSPHCNKETAPSHHSL